jgi:hypothetical protein
VDDRVAAVKAALEAHPAVTSVELVGSRAGGEAHELSDWDLSVQTGDFDRLSSDLPALLAPVRPLAHFWDPYSNHHALMVILSGPMKLDVCFFDRPRSYDPPYGVRADNLAAIDRHFWDWILWTEQKRIGGKEDAVRESLELMYSHMLGPMGVEDEPKTVPAALAAYLAARGRLEQELDVTIDRTLEWEVLPVLRT